ncbi:MAG: NAD-dependent epimerase/dehydratase family protein, partial [Burkholderiaceae bacterium]
MVILLTGAGGFIGRRLADALARRGHRVIGAVRDPSRLRDPRFDAVAADFTVDVEPAAWLLKLAGVDLVINAAGILRERGAQTFDAIHRRGPRALFAACSLAGVPRVIHISALGADAGAVSRYHRSKKATDDFLAGLPLHSTIVQPSLVYGPGGASARLFETLAALPLIPVPGHGAQSVQPIHVDDLVEALVALAESPPSSTSPASSVRLAAVGPEPVSLRLFLAKLRAAMRLPRARWLPVPMPLMRVAARAG